MICLICAIKGASSGAHFPKTQEAILSGPGDFLLGLSFRRRRLTSSLLQLIFSSFMTETQSGVPKHREEVGVDALNNREVVCHNSNVDF